MCLQPADVFVGDVCHGCRVHRCYRANRMPSRLWVLVLMLMCVWKHTVYVSLLSFNYFSFASHSSDFPYSECVLHIHRYSNRLLLLLQQHFFSLALAISPIYLCLFNLMRYASFFILHLKAFFPRVVHFYQYQFESAMRAGMHANTVISIPRAPLPILSVFSISVSYWIRDACTRCDILCIFNFPYCHCYTKK